VPIPLLFGGLIVPNVLRGSLYDRVKQPLRGVLNVVTIAAVGSGLLMLFHALSPLISGALPSGPPAYQLEIWLASATLGITFPLLIVHAEFLDFWPFGANPRSANQPGAESPATRRGTDAEPR
jgi:hypothetical protein